VRTGERDECVDAAVRVVRLQERQARGDAAHAVRQQRDELPVREAAQMQQRLVDVRRLLEQRGTVKGGEVFVEVDWRSHSLSIAHSSPLHSVLAQGWAQTH
jgi:hypothetical protein